MCTTKFCGVKCMWAVSCELQKLMADGCVIYHWWQDVECDWMPDGFHNLTSTVWMISSWDFVIWLQVWTRQSALIFPTSYPNATYLGVCTQGYDPKFELSWDFCTMHLPPKFHQSYVYSFGTQKKPCWRTRTETDAAENIQRSSLCYDVG